MEWISVKEKLPISQEQTVLALINDKVYIGHFIVEKYYRINSDQSHVINPDGSIKHYKMEIRFYCHCFLNYTYCDDCESGSFSNDEGRKQCVDCCENDYCIALLTPCFDLDKVDYWMPLPEIPNNNDIYKFQ